MRERFHVPYIIYWANALQVIWGVCLIAQPDLARVAVLGGASLFTDNGISSVFVAGILFLLFAALATVGIRGNERAPHRALFLLMLLPQYLVIILASVTNAVIIITGRYEGREFDRWLLIALLAPLIVAGYLHSLAILERYQLWKSMQSLLRPQFLQPPES